MYVYAIECKGRVKIGIANDPGKRLLDMQVGNPERLVLLHKRNFGTRYVAQSVETDLHQILEFQHVLGEWFEPEPIDPMGWLDLFYEQYVGGNYKTPHRG